MRFILFYLGFTKYRSGSDNCYDGSDRPEGWVGYDQVGSRIRWILARIIKNLSCCRRVVA